jgi:hypothetical protein
MSVSLEEALNGAGYRFDKVDDCIWLLGKKEEFEELFEKAEELHDKYADWQYEKETAEDDGDYNFPDFNEWLVLKGEK